jgi:peptidoglycan hydrolase-like protein with peptidoglycan-binding domain
MAEITYNIKDRTSANGMTDRAQRILDAAARGADAAGLSRIEVTAAKGGGHKSHGNGTEWDIKGYNRDGSLWNNAQRVAVAEGARLGTADRIGVYRLSGGLGGGTLHLGYSGPGRPAAVWGANGLTNGAKSRQFTHPAEKAFFAAYSSGRPLDLASLDFNEIQVAASRTPGTLESLFGRGELPAPTPPANVSEIGSTRLKQGMANSRVAALQTALQAAGYSVGPKGADGVFGKATKEALTQFQKDRGLEPVGYAGPKSRELLGNILAQRTQLNAPGVSLEARDAAAAARQPSIPSFSQAEAARAAPLQGAPTIPVDRRALPDIQRPLASPADNNAPPGIGTPAIDMASRRRMTPNQMVDAVESAAIRRMQAQAARPLASAADNNAPPGIGIAPASSGDPRLDLVRKALRPVGPEGGISTPADPRGWGPIAANRIAGIGRADAPVPRMNPSRASLAGSGSPLEAGVTAPNIRRPDFDFAGNANSSDNRAPPHIGFETPAQSDERIARYGLTPAAVTAAGQRSLSQPRSVQSTSIPQNVRISRPQVGVSDMVRAAGASARPVTDPAAMRRSFDIMGYAPDDPFGTRTYTKNQDRLSSPVANVFNRAPTPVAAAASARPAPPAMSRAFDIMSPQAPTDIRPVFSAPKRTVTTSNLFANYAATQPATLKPPAPAPAYTATSPVAPPVPKPNPFAAPQMPGVAAATPVPAMPAPVPPKFIDMPMAAKVAMGVAIPGIGLGIGALNKIFGGGFNQSTAARNARVSAGVQASDLVGGAYGNASYGRRQSDGSVTGTTRSGTGYTSRDGGREIDIGGRTYRANRGRAGYSLDLSRR